MKIKVLCDRCFKDVMKDKVLYKVGSEIYCKKCQKKIEMEIFCDLAEEYFSNTDSQKEKELELQIINYPFLERKHKNEYAI